MRETLHVPVETAHGPQVRPDGSVLFRLWAPECNSVAVEIIGQPPRPMIATGDGWHELIVSGGAGTRYLFVLPDGMRIPDPASRFQPEDVHGPSEVIDPASWEWSDAQWRGRSWQEAVIYELHVGAFTPEGTFRGVAEKLDYLARLGVTAIELMPVGDFSGSRNWGYDGVLPYAPDSTYGRPEDLKALIEQAHARDVMVFLDVVYNHFGADGNYLSLYAPQFFTKRHQTPWGEAVNFDSPGSHAVRNFVIDNALYWIQQFHVDGLRLDAVHAIRDESAIHLLQGLAEQVHAATPGRQVHLILENEENQARWLEGNPRCYTAQWNDDVHHALHTAVTREGQGYYGEYLDDTIKLGRALAEGFAFQGEMMAYRGSPRGEASRHLQPEAFVTFLQNHDQVGNRAFGDRIGQSASPQALRAAAAVYLLLPQIPMLFMGEEWNASSPFPFFCDFGPELAAAVRQGRRREFAKFPEFQDPAQRERIPDPQAPETFAAAKLQWTEREKPGHREWLEWYRRILARRRESIWPRLARMEHGGDFEVLAKGAVVVRWGELMLAANLSEAAVSGFPSTPAVLIWQEGSTKDQTFQPWTVQWWVTQ